MRTIGLLLVLMGCDAVHDRPVPTWSYLHAAIIAPNCATSSCHSQISSVAGMDLSTPTSAYAMLTGHTCNAPVVGGEVDASYVKTQLIDALNGVGERKSAGKPYPTDLLMPPDQPLSASEIELVVRWYEAGAACD